MPKHEQKYAIGNSTVQVVIGDIIKSGADVIVSSDDSALTMRGGVSKALRNAGGESIFQEAQKQVGSA